MTFDAGILRTLCRSKLTGVLLLREHGMSLSLDKRFFRDSDATLVMKGVTETLLSMFMKFDPRF